jgi:hypothetical protein
VSEWVNLSTKSFRVRRNSTTRLVDWRVVSSHLSKVLATGKQLLLPSSHAPNAYAKVVLVILTLDNSSGYDNNGGYLIGW